jgi:hypothetical protein
MPFIAGPGANLAVVLLTDNNVYTTGNKSRRQRFCSSCWR